jgi:hypothetical protein
LYASVDGASNRAAMLGGKTRGLNSRLGGTRLEHGPKSLYANQSRKHLTHSRVWLASGMAAKAPRNPCRSSITQVVTSPKRPPRGVRRSGCGTKCDECSFGTGACNALYGVPDMCPRARQMASRATHELRGFQTLKISSLSCSITIA